MKTVIENLIYKEECYAIIGGCFTVYKDKGCGFLEPVYQECLEIEVPLASFSVFSGKHSC